MAKDLLLSNTIESVSASFHVNHFSIAKLHLINHKTAPQSCQNGIPYQNIIGVHTGRQIYRNECIYAWVDGYAVVCVQEEGLTSREKR